METHVRLSWALPLRGNSSILKRERQGSPWKYRWVPKLPNTPRWGSFLGWCEFQWSTGNKVGEWWVGTKRSRKEVVSSEARGATLHSALIGGMNSPWFTQDIYRNLRIWDRFTKSEFHPLSMPLLNDPLTHTQICVLREYTHEYRHKPELYL